MEWQRGNGYSISDDPTRLDLEVILGFLVDAYWCHGLPRDVLERSIAHSVCFGLYAPGGGQAGFARVVTDHATVAWVCDVFILPDHRGRRLGVWLMETVAAHPDLQGLRRWLLGTRDAHDLYRKTGYTLLSEEEASRFMLRPTQATYGPGAPSPGEPVKSDRHGRQ